MGKGATFTVRLPLTNSGAPQNGIDACPVIKEFQHPGRLRILVVDDNADAAETMSTYLGVCGHSTRVGYTGYHALELVRKFQPEIVFLDIGMPGMNGYDAAREIRKIPEMSGITLVALTGWGAESDRLRAYEAGFDHHLTKPSSFADVEAILAGIAGRPVG